MLEKKKENLEQREPNSLKYILDSLASSFLSLINDEAFIYKKIIERILTIMIHHKKSTCMQ